MVSVSFLDVLGRVPLMPCYLNGIPTPTIPHDFNHLRQHRYKDMGIFPDNKFGSGNGSKLFRLNVFLWSFGRGLPRNLPVEETQALRDAALAAAKKKSAETRKRRRRAAGLEA